MVEAAAGVTEEYVCDLSDLSSVAKLAAKVEKIDVLVNVAGVWHGENEAYSGINFAKFSEKVVLDTFNVGLLAPTILVHGLLSKMASGAHIINISGTFEGGAKGWLPYYVSKRGIEDLTVGLAQELEDKQIFVNCVSPSDVATEEYKKYFPKDARNALDPGEVANFVADLCSKDVSGKVFVLKKGQLPFEKFHA